MKILLQRKPSTEFCTYGELFVEDIFECYTLEDVVRLKKIYGKTAIPAGTYKIIITMSNRFHKELPLLLAVPGSSGVRIHTGNTSRDTEGCIILGRTIPSYDEDWISKSGLAFRPFMKKLKQAASKGEEIEITIRNSSAVGTLETAPSPTT